MFTDFCKNCQKKVGYEITEVTLPCGHKDQPAYGLRCKHFLGFAPYETPPLGSDVLAVCKQELTRSLESGTLKEALYWKESYEKLEGLLEIIKYLPKKSE